MNVSVTLFLLCSATTGQSFNQRLVLVEDDLVDREAVMRALPRLGIEVEVEHASNGYDALSLLRTVVAQDELKISKEYPSLVSYLI
ncbi:MAG: hypothetical protein KDD62_03705 [Bdellovibrionales bacterium]|nr:hypothetical protein [Bdellovibrionales bacterium]